MVKREIPRETTNVCVGVKPTGAAYDESKQPFLALFFPERDLDFDKKASRFETKKEMDTKDDAEPEQKESLLEFFASHSFAESLCAALEVIHQHLGQESPFKPADLVTFCSKNLKELWRKIFWGLGIRKQPVEDELVDSFNDLHGDATLTAGAKKLERHAETVEVGKLIDTKRIHLCKVLPNTSPFSDNDTL